ncbi:MAG: hypothetical protein ACR65X_01675 [Methylocystis sp.]
MTGEIELSNYEPSDWISELPPALRRTIEEMLGKGLTFDQIADGWLSASGPDNTFPYGGERANETLFANVRAELYKLICGDPAYEDIRQQARSLIEQHKTQVATVIAGAVGSVLGIAAAALLPVVCLVLASATSVGVNAWCNRKND